MNIKDHNDSDLIDRVDVYVQAGCCLEATIRYPKVFRKETLYLVCTSIPQNIFKWRRDDCRALCAVAQLRHVGDRVRNIVRDMIIIIGFNSS